MKILVIEDEKKLAAYLAEGLRQEGYQADVAHTGMDGLHLAIEGPYDLVLLDCMLPGLDGIAVLSALRQSKQVPVLMLTAKGEVEDRVRGLRAGADDYLAKPFAFSELIARTDRLKLADLEVDLIKHRALRGGRVLDLTPKEFALLTLLMENAGRVLTRTQIAETVWHINFDTETNVVEVAIRRLRVKLDVPFEQSLLHTVRGVGYILESRNDGQPS